MGARRLTNKTVAKRAGVGVMTVSKIRNGDPRVGYMTLKKVVEALGLTIAEVLEAEGHLSRVFFHRLHGLNKSL